MRTPVMTLVDISWHNAAGTLQTLRARMEDKSAGGACLRVKSSFLVGAKLRIQWRFEQFSGTVKYCRPDGSEYLVGIQRDAGNPAPGALTPAPSAFVQPQKAVLMAPGGLHNPDNRHFETSSNADPRESDQSKDDRVKDDRSKDDRSAPTNGRGSHSAESVFAQIPPSAPSGLRSKATPGAAIPTKPPAATKSQGVERKTMASKWLGLAPWRKKEEGSVSGNSSSAKENPVAHDSAPRENNLGRSAREVPVFQVELLSVEDVYESVGIPHLRKGYSVAKVVEMLKSEHLRGLSVEMKRAAVLMALDAAGISIEQIQRDARMRQEALDAYELAQKSQAEKEWSQKAEEMVLVRAELESLKAHYTARIERGLEAIARDKSRFNEWSARKQREAQDMADALALCLKSPSAEPNVSASAAPAPPQLASSASASGAD